MKINRIFSAVMAGLLILSVAACSKKEATIATAYPDEKVGFQLEMPTKGEDEIAIMHTSMGDIKIRFFSEGAPKAVENFKTHSKNGYYNGLIFHRVFNDFMIQGGDPEGTGGGGESIYGANFEDEFDSKLLNLRGSLAMANSGPKTNGSQFFINQAGASKFPGRDSFDEETIKEQHKGYYEQNKLAFAQQKGITTFEEYFKEAVPYLSPDPKLVPEDVWEAYEKTGGNIHLDGAWRAEGGHTVFGQVFEGMDIVDKIAAVTADAEGKPTIDVKINTIEIIKY